MASTGETLLKQKMSELKDELDAGNITQEEFDRIQRLKQYEVGDLSGTTIENHVQQLKKFAVRTSDRITEMDESDVVRVLEQFKSGLHPDVKDNGIIVNNYISALRKFYRFHDDLPVTDEMEIDVDEEYDGREITPDDLLYQEEVDALLEAAQRNSPRDMALIAIMLATGQRKDAVRTLRLKHIEQDGPTMEMSLNESEGALKGASGSRALLWAKHFVRPWVESHPYKGNPDAALFPPKTGSSNPKDPLSPKSIARVVKERAKEAGIDKNVYPHLLRHSAITRMVAEGLSEQQIKQIAGWHGDSSQFETYVNLADKLQTDSVRESLGLPTSDSGPAEVGRPSLERCPNCGDQLPDDRERCPTCNSALTHREAEEGEPDTTTADPSDVDVSEMSDENKLELLEQLKEDIRG